MTQQSRIFEKFASEDAFLEAVGAAMRSFDYERTIHSDGTFSIKAPGHSVVTNWPKLRWRPFRSQDKRVAGYELPAVAVMSFILRTFDIKTFYDIGASRGILALLAASTETRRIVAHAFEMNPIAVDLMHAELAGNPDLAGRFIPHLSGMSDKHEGSRPIWFARTQMFDSEPQPHQYKEAWWRRLKFWWRGVADRERVRKADVIVTCIDHMAQTEGPAPEFLKIDVDGYECKVLPGGMNTFTAQRPFLLLELHKDALLERFGKTRREVIAPLLELGYRAAVFEDHNAARAAGLQPVEPDSPVWSRQKTDMFLLY